MLGPYQIIGQIGEGGMATVYKAYQPSMDRNVAIKVLPRQLAVSEEFRQRFQQERASSPNWNIRTFCRSSITARAMGSPTCHAYLDPGTLKEKMVSGSPLPLNEIDRLFTQLAEALSSARMASFIATSNRPTP